MNAELEKVADRFRAEGRKVYTIPGGGSNPTGALGYANCAMELLNQANARDLKIDHIVHATGSAGTQAGLVVGLQAMNANIPLLGVSVRLRNRSRRRTSTRSRNKRQKNSGALEW